MQAPLVDQSLLDSPVPLFVEKRQRRDTAVAVVYTLGVLVAFASGVFSVLYRNDAFWSLFDPDSQSDPKTCPHSGTNTLLGAKEDVPVPTYFINHFALYLISSAAGSILLGCGYVLAVKHAPGLVVRLTVAVQVLLPLSFGLVALFNNQVPVAVPLLVLAGLTALVFCLWRKELELVQKLLGTTAHGLAENTVLIAFALVLQVVLVLLMFAFMICAAAPVLVGRVIPNSQRVGTSQPCVDASGQTVPCCAWQADGKAVFLSSFNVFMLIWTVMLAYEIKTFVIAGTIAQWYFAPIDQRPYASARFSTSLRHAFGASFGTLCFGSLVLTLVQYARSALQQLKDAGDQNILACILFFLLNAVYSFIEYITKFATVMASITGESFLEASRSMTGLLSRNLLDTLGVWWFPPMILQTLSFTLAACAGCFTWSVTSFLWGSSKEATSSSIILALIVWLMSWVVLSFLSSMLLSIIDAVYVCFALDRESHTCTRLEVHQVYCLLPSYKGGVVENPGGDYAFAVPPSGGPLPPYQPPPSQPHFAYGTITPGAPRV